MNAIEYQKDAHGIAHLILDKPDSPVNLMDDGFADDFELAVAKIAGDAPKGVIIRSNKTTFFAGGDLVSLSQINHENAHQAYEMTMRIKTSMRQLETLGIPVVACISGAALGGGFEITLACTHRVALNHKSVQLGCPEVTLGLLPGAGGVTRLTRLLGIQAALPYLAQGKIMRPGEAHSLGIVHELVETPEALIDAAVNHINSNPAQSQPYDQKGYRLPGGTPSSPKLAQALMVAPAMLYKQTRGNMPAPEAILSAMVEGSQVDFDTACRIESRYFAELAKGKVAKNLINTFFFQKNEIDGGKNRPQGPRNKLTRVAVLGAGMMGAGIAYSAAIKGIEVVLKDVTLENAERGKDYSRKLLQKRAEKGRMTPEKVNEVLDKITCTANAETLAGCELVIEAVFEDRNLKAQVTQEAEAQISENAIFGSNTSTLPITGLAQASSRPSNFIGIHFFSPVDKMPLVEIICGEQSSDEALMMAYDFTLQLGKTPIVVNDSRGFYTSRVFSTFVKEGVQMLREADAAEIENGAWLAGFPVGPLAVVDEVSLTLIDKITRQTKKDLEAQGKTLGGHPADDIFQSMLDLERAGKLAGKGFYEYPEQGKKYLWPEVNQQFKTTEQSIPLIDIKERLLFIMAIETVRCLDEQVLRSVGDANIGSIFGIGYPAWTGGTLQYINHVGVSEFVERADELAERYGERFSVPESLRNMARNQERF